MVRVVLTNGQTMESIEIEAATQVVIEHGFVPDRQSRLDSIAALRCKDAQGNIVGEFKHSTVIGYAIDDERAPQSQTGELRSV